jgi:hypothetical protein
MSNEPRRSFATYGLNLRRALRTSNNVQLMNKGQSLTLDQVARPWIDIRRSDPNQGLVFQGGEWRSQSSSSRLWECVVQHSDPIPQKINLLACACSISCGGAKRDFIRSNLSELDRLGPSVVMPGRNTASRLDTASRRFGARANLKKSIAATSARLLRKRAISASSLLRVSSSAERRGAAC